MKIRDGYVKFRQQQFPEQAELFHGLRKGQQPEVLFITRKRGYSIREVPIDWYFNADSRVRPVHDTLAMVHEVLRIRLNDWRGVYDA